jgi:hypothetical protein
VVDENEKRPPALVTLPKEKRDSLEPLSDDAIRRALEEGRKACGDVHATTKPSVNPKQRFS